MVCFDFEAVFTGIPAIKFLEGTEAKVTVFVLYHFHFVIRDMYDAL
jgi:hypothetical protein